MTPKSHSNKFLLNSCNLTFLSCKCQCVCFILQMSDYLSALYSLTSKLLWISGQTFAFYTADDCWGINPCSWHMEKPGRESLEGLEHLYWALSHQETQERKIWIFPEIKKNSWSKSFKKQGRIELLFMYLEHRQVPFKTGIICKKKMVNNKNGMFGQPLSTVSLRLLFCDVI